MNFQGPRKKRVKKPARDKSSRWRRKQQNAGACPHCGKPCAPFAECAERRFQKRIWHILSKGVKAGMLIRLERGLYISSDADPTTIAQERATAALRAAKKNQ